MQRVGISLTWPSDETADLHGFSPLLADVDGAVAEQFGVRRGRLGERLGGRVQRATFPSAPTGSRVKRHVYGGAEASSSFGHPLSPARRLGASSSRASSPTTSASTSSASASTTRMPSRCPRATSLSPPSPARTGRFHLGSAVTVLTYSGPLHVLQRYSTWIPISGSHAEVILGRGWGGEPFPLFTTARRLQRSNMCCSDQLRIAGCPVSGGTTSAWWAVRKSTATVIEMRPATTACVRSCSRHKDSIREIIDFFRQFMGRVGSTVPYHLTIKLHPIHDSNKAPYLEAFQAYRDRVDVISGEERPATFNLLQNAHLHVSVRSVRQPLRCNRSWGSDHHSAVQRHKSCFLSSEPAMHGWLGRPRIL